MSCHLPVVDQARDPERCRCQGAVLRTYKSMSDEPHKVAIEVALRVYQHHHPEDGKGCAALIVERWVCEAVGSYH